MAKLKIGATITMCGASGHSWQVGLAANYRQCSHCRSVEVLIDGQWLSPTGRAKRKERAEVSSAPSWMQSAGVTDSDLRATIAPLVTPPQSPAMTVPPAALASEQMFEKMTRRNLGDLLFKWGTNHDYPQISFLLPSGRTHTIVSGVAAWRVTSYQCPLEVVEAALDCAARYTPPELSGMVPAERVKRLELLVLGQEWNWARLVYQKNPGSSLVLDGDERGWIRFAYAASYERIVEVCDLLIQWRIVRVERSVPGQDLRQVRARFLDLAEEARYPVLRFQIGDEGIVYQLLNGGQAEYEDRAQHATLRWLWSAVKALELVRDGVRDRVDLGDAVVCHEAEKGVVE